MFTGNTIALAEVATRHGVKLVRDCAFSYVGKIPTQLDRRLVACAKARHIADAVKQNGIAGIVTTEDLAHLVPENYGLGLCEKPQSALYSIHEELCANEGFLWSSFDSRIEPGAYVHPSAVIAPRDVVIGRDSVIGPNVVVHDRSVIAENCALAAGTVIGGPAFEVDTGRSPRKLLSSAGGVRIGPYADLKEYCLVARATFGGFTTVGRETKFDCGVSIAHDCQVGAFVRIAGYTGMSGRVTVGDHALIGPSCIIANGLNIGENATVSIGSVVARNVKPGAHVTGNFAVPHAKWLKFLSSIS